MYLIFQLILLLLSLYLLLRVCDEYFIPALEAIAHKKRISHDVAGATFMALGTSAPELFVTLIAIVISLGSADGNVEMIGIGAIAGSCLFNLLVVIGVSAIMGKPKINQKALVRDSIFYGISIFLIVMMSSDRLISFGDSVILLAVYGGYIFVLKKQNNPVEDEVLVEEKEFQEEVVKQEQKISFFAPLNNLIARVFKKQKDKYIHNFVASILLIAVSSWLLVESSVNVAHELGISEFIIGLLIVSIGTSLPELVSSVIVAKKGKGSMAISNAFGSNIFNILLGLGIPYFIVSLFSGDVAVESSDMLTIFASLILSLGVFLLMLNANHWKLNKKIGLAMIGVYAFIVLIMSFV